MATYRGLAMSVSAREGKTLEEYFQVPDHVPERDANEDSLDDLREWFSYSAHYAYWSESGNLCFCDGGSERDNWPY